MRALFKLLFLLLLLSPVAIAIMIWLALSNTPQVAEQVTLSHQDIARAKQILKANDPRRLPPGTQRSIEIALADLNLASSYLVQHLAGGHSRLNAADDTLVMRASIELPKLPIRNILNFEAKLRAEEGRPVLDSLKIGELAMPGPIAGWAAERAVGLVSDTTQIAAALASIEDLRLFPDRVQLRYRWHPALIENARQSLLTGVDRDALRYYHDLLVELQGKGVGTQGSVMPLLGAMFAAAGQRSQHADPIIENTALLTVLGTWASRRNIGRLVPGNIPRPGRFRLKLHRRLDFAQHFLASAALAARGDTALSDAVGLFKELADTNRGSGFSFTDIAADRTGTRFGELATRSAQDARKLQRYIAQGVSEKDVMPDARDLPEHMNAATFKQRFGNIGSPAYTSMMDEIERRIDNTPLYLTDARR